MSETEVERLVVRLTGDGSLFQKMMTTASESSAKVAEQVRAASEKIEGIKQNLEGFASTAVRVMSAFGMATSLEAAFEKFEDAEKGVIRLTAAIRASGAPVDATMNRYKAFAEEVASTTSMSKGAVLALITHSQQLGIAGKEAEDLARMSIALAAARGTDASSEFMLARAMKAGNTERIARLIGMGREKDQTKVLAQANSLLKSGYEAQVELGKTVGAQIERLQRSLGGMAKEIGAIVSDAIGPFVKVLTQVFQQINRLDPTTKRWIAGIIAAYLALEFIPRTLRVMMSLLGALQVTKLASIALWGLWKIAVLAANGVLLLFNAQVAFWKVLMGAAIALATGWSVGSALATAATWAWNAALAVMDALLAPEALLAAVVAIVAIGAAVVGTAAVLGVAAVAAYALYEAGKSVVAVLAGLSNTGPIAVLTGMFREWWQIIKDVAEAAQVDLPLAWEIAKAGFVLMVNQLRDQWPPLWKFIQEGFRILWDVAAAEFERSFRLALVEAIGSANRLAGTMTDQMEEDISRIRRNTEQARANDIKFAADEMKKALEGFKPGEESDATKKAREELEKLRAKLKQIKELEDPKPPPPPPGAPYKEATKEVEKMTAAIYGSAEAATRIAQYQQEALDAFSGKKKGGADSNKSVTGGVIQAATGGAEAKTRQEQQLVVLRDIRDTLKSNKAQTIGVEPADFDA